MSGQWKGTYEDLQRRLVSAEKRVAELEAAPSANRIPRDTDEKPSDAMPAAGFADWRESSEWWQHTCEYWKARADALAGDGAMPEIDYEQVKSDMPEKLAGDGGSA